VTDSSWKKEFILRVYTDRTGLFTQLQKMPHADSVWILKNFYLPVVAFLPVPFFIISLFSFSSVKKWIFSGFVLPAVLSISLVAFVLIFAQVTESLARLWRGKPSYHAGSKLALFSFYPLLFSFFFLPLPFGYLVSMGLAAYGFFMIRSGAEILLGLDPQSRIMWYISLGLVYFLFIISFILILLSLDILFR